MYIFFLSYHLNHKICDVQNSHQYIHNDFEYFKNKVYEIIYKENQMNIDKIIGVCNQIIYFHLLSSTNYYFFQFFNIYL